MRFLVRHSNVYWLLFFFQLVWSVSAFACKYTVRDIGFTDLGAIEYKLYFYVDETTPQEIISTFEQLTYAAFLDANVDLEIIHLDEQSNHPARSYLNQQKNVSVPAIILADAEDNTLLLPFSYTNENFNESLWRHIEKVVSSSMRKKIIKMVKNTYGAVLLIEGNNEEMNRKAKKAISGAIQDITNSLKLMPKLIENPPQMIVMSKSDISKEQVLLWSINARVKQSDQPQVVVLYGRGRRIGPVLTGKEIIKDNIFSLLAIIGADCECGLDRSVMLGKMIPLRWEKEIQTELAEQLGFDVENPMIKSEMSQILSLSVDLQKGNNSKNPLSAYKEGIIKFDIPPSAPTVSSRSLQSPESSESNSVNNIIIYQILYSVIGIFLLILIISYYIFVRKKNIDGKIKPEI